MKPQAVGDRRKIAAPPLSTQCPACHGRYFSASVVIHQKSCFQRNGFVLIPCEKCKEAIRAACFHEHVASCSEAPAFDRSANNETERRAKTAVAPCGPMDLNLPEADGRVRCKVCERAFSQDRIAKHQSVCHGKPRGANGPQKPRYRTIARSARSQPSRAQTKVMPALAPRLLRASFDMPVRENLEGSGRPIKSSSQLRDTGRFRSGGYPGAQAMKSGGWDASNATSASNPLVTNPLMTTAQR